MKNTDKIRELLKQAQDYAKDSNIKRLDAIDANQTYKWIMQDMFKCIDEALALLPCETCNDTGKIPRPDRRGWPIQHQNIPCPDCQKTS